MTTSMSAAQIIENALGISDLDLLASSILDTVDNPVEFSKADKLALLDEIQRRLYNIRTRIIMEN